MNKSKIVVLAVKSEFLGFFLDAKDSFFVAEIKLNNKIDFTLEYDGLIMDLKFENCSDVDRLKYFYSCYEVIGEL